MRGLPQHVQVLLHRVRHGGDGNALSAAAIALSAAVALAAAAVSVATAAVAQLFGTAFPSPPPPSVE